MGGKFIEGTGTSYVQVSNYQYQLNRGCLLSSIPVLNPATNQPLTSVTSASASDVESAISAAQDVFTAGTWSRAPALHRATVLTRLARLLEARVPDLAQVESMQTGRTIREMKVQLARLPEWM